MSEIAREKRMLRVQMRERLAAITSEQAEAWSRQACAALAAFEPMRSARCVLGYAAITTGSPGELDVATALAGVLARGGQVCLPAIDWDARTMRPAAVDSLDSLIARRYGVPEPPAGSAMVELAEIDVILVPGLAFDSRGGRLGRGAGFYDRLLERVGDEVGIGGGQPVVIGVGFGLQLCDRVPMEPHDRRMDAIASETGVAAVIG